MLKTKNIVHLHPAFQKANYQNIITKIFKDRGVNVISILTRSTGEVQREIIIRADLTNAMDIIEEIREAGFNVTDISTLKVQ